MDTQTKTPEHALAAPFVTPVRVLTLRAHHQMDQQIEKQNNISTHYTLVYTKIRDRAARHQWNVSNALSWKPFLTPLTQKENPNGSPNGSRVSPKSPQGQSTR